MGYFDFLTPDLQDGSDVEDAEGQRAQEYQADERRQLASDESDNVQREQNALRLTKTILKNATSPGRPGSANYDLVRVRDAMDKGMLKPHQLASDLETILKKRVDPSHLNALDIQGLTSALNDLKVADQKKAEIQSRSAQAGTAPDVSPDVLRGFSQQATDKAKALREEASRMGVLGSGDKIAQAKNLEGQAVALSQDADQRAAQGTNGVTGPGGTNIQGATPGEPTYFDDNGNKIPYEQWRQTHQDLQGSIDSNVKAAGRDPKQFRQAMIAGAQKLEQTMGVDTANLKDPVPFSRALLTGLQIFDPQGIILQQLSQDLQPNASAGGGQQTTSAGSGQGLSATKTTPEEDLHTKNLAAMRDQRRSLYQQLGQTPELNNWFGVLTFIFLSVITRSPSVAASILGISQRQGNLKAQLDLIEKDMHDEAFQLKQAQHEGDIARKMAADRALHQSDKADDYKRELMKMYLNHHAILLREAQRHPEGGEAYKRLDKDFARYSSMESSAHSEMMRADKDRNDPFADDAHKAQAEKDYQNSRKVWLFWSNKRKELNQTLEEMHVGGAGASGIEETPQ